MSKLILGLKEKNNLVNKAVIYLPKEIYNDNRIKEIKKKFGLKSSSEALKFCILHSSFNWLDVNKELYEQLKYSENPTMFYNKTKEFEDTTTLTIFKKKYTKIEVLNWHLIVCLSKFGRDYTNNYDFLDKILCFSWNKFGRIGLDESLENYKVEVPNVFFDNIDVLKMLHGNYKKNNLLRRCFELYAYNNNNNNNSNSFRSYANKYFDEFDKKSKSTSEVDLYIPINLAETLNFKYDHVNDIENVINYNLRIFDNLFPERNIKNGKIT